MFSKRQIQLLGQLAEGFRNGTCLLASTEWLSDNGVTLDECIALSNAIGLCIDMATKTKSKELQAAMLLNAVR